MTIHEGTEVRDYANFIDAGDVAPVRNGQDLDGGSPSQNYTPTVAQLPEVKDGIDGGPV